MKSEKEEKNRKVETAYHQDDKRKTKSEDVLVDTLRKGREGVKTLREEADALFCDD